MWQNFVIKQNKKKTLLSARGAPFQGRPEATASIASRSCATATPALGSPRQNIAVKFGVEKLEWWSYGE